MLLVRGIAVRWAFALSLLAILGGCNRSQRNDVDLRQWNDLINRSLPLGSTRADVERFLDQRHIDHSYVDQSKFSDEGNSEIALIRSNDKDGIVRKAGVQLKFRFNTDGRLQSFESKEVFTGP